MQEPIAGAVAEPEPALELSGRLVLWNGLPTLPMLIAERTTRRVVWSGMAVADADHIAARSIDRLAELRSRLAALPRPLR